MISKLPFNSLALALLMNFGSYAQTAPKAIITFKVSGKKTNASFTKSQGIKSDTLCSTRYAVFTGVNDTLYKIQIHHNHLKNQVRTTIVDKDGNSLGNFPAFACKYHASGLIFNNTSLLDTAIDANKTYDWQYFYNDTSRTYLSSGFITISDTINISLDKFSKGILSEHSRISKSLLANPPLVKVFNKNDRNKGRYISQLENAGASSSQKAAGRDSEIKQLKSELGALREKSNAMFANYDSLCDKVYRLSFLPNAYTTVQKDVWDIKTDSLLYKHAHENYFENTDVKLIIKIQTDTSGVVTAADLVFPTSVSALSSKDSYLFTVLTGIIKKETFPTNKVDIYGKKYAVKTYLEKELFISVKNRKEKILYTDKDNVSFNETKLPLEKDVKDQFNAKMYAGAKAGKYGAQIMSFTVNKLTKEVVKSVDF
jgi:hypothetical protein